EPMLYRSSRYGLYTDFSYVIPVSNGAYRVRLSFAEGQYYTAGSRVFHVDLNGARVLPNFDITREAGAARMLVTREFPVHVVDGQIQLAFTGVVTRGMVNAIEIFPDGPAAP